MKLETRLIHQGEPRPRIGGAITVPIFQSSTFEFYGGDDYHEIPYVRLSNTPNHLVLGEKLRNLEGAEAGLVTSSGMSAIATTFLALLSSGDHILVQADLYGGTHHLITSMFADYGITYSFVDGSDPSQWGECLTPTTRGIYLETLSNPLLKIPDLQGAVGFAREHGLISMIDNTFASPVNFEAAEFGFDVVLHSATKYLNGHSDVAAGAILGRDDLVKKIKKRLDHLGGVLDPHACFLLHRGLKTLALRVRQQNENAFVLAKFLEEHPAVTSVHYPGLSGDPFHEQAVKYLQGFGGMVSFTVEGGLPVAHAWQKELKLPLSAASLGGVETLVTIPAENSHAGLTADELKDAGIDRSLIRVSVGIEAVDDLVEDFSQALAVSAGAS